MGEIKGLDLRKMREETEASAASPLVKLTPRIIHIPLDYKDPNGKEHSAVLEAKILDGDERFKQSRMAVDMLQGATWDDSPPLYRQRAFMLSWLIFALVKPPEWFLEWSQQDIHLLSAIYTEVELHEQLYFRGVDEKGQAHPEGANIRVASPFASDSSA